MPPAVPRRPQAAESKPPRAGQRTAFFHRCPARPEKRGPGRRRHGTRPKRTTARAPERGPRPSLPPGRWGAPASQLQPPKRGRARAGQGLPALAPGLDVMDLQPVRTVTEGAAPAVALVHAAPHAVWDTGRHAVHVLVLHCLFRPFCPLWAVPLQPRSQGRSRRQAAGRARANRPGHSRDCARPGLYSRVIMKRPKRASSPSCSRGAAIAVCPASATAAPSFRCPGTRRDNGGTC